MRNILETNVIRRFVELRNWISLIAQLFLTRKEISPSAISQGILVANFENQRKLNDNEAEDFIKRYAEFLMPKKEIDLTRVGSTEDGGYYIYEMNEAPNLLSGGVADNVEFEEYFLNRSSLVHAYDPTIESWPSRQGKKLKFFRSGLESSKEKLFHNSVSLDEALILFRNDPHYNIDAPNLLKLDIEGSEISLLSQNPENLSFFDQIVIEFHDLHRLGERIDEFEKIFIFLKKHFFTIAASPNNNRGLVNYGRSIVSIVFEVTLLKRKYEGLIQTSPNSTAPSINNRSKLPLPTRPFIHLE